MSEADWVLWLAVSPPRDEELDFKRDESDQRWTGRSCDLRSEFNICGVSWRRHQNVSGTEKVSAGK